MALDLANLISEAELLSEQERGWANQVIQLNTTAQELHQVATEQTAAEVSAGAAVVEAANIAALETQNARLTVANSLGTNVNAVTDIITGLNEKMRQEAVALVDQQRAVGKLQSEATLSNPIGLLKDVLVGDAERAKLASLEGNFDRTHKVLSALHNQTQTAAVTANAISAPLTKASIAAATEQAIAAGNAKLATMKMEGLNYGLAVIETKQKLGTSQFNRLMSIQDRIRQEAEWQENMRFRKEQFTSLQDARKDKQNDRVYWQDVTARINVANAVMGLPPVNEETVSRTYPQNSPLGQSLRDKEYRGFVALESGGTITLGTDAAESYSTIVTHRPKLPEAFEPSRKLLEAGQAEIDRVSSLISSGTPVPAGTNTYGLTPTTIKDPAVVRRAFNNAVDGIAQRLLADTTIPENPYVAAPLTVIAEQAPEFAQSRFFEEVAKPLINSGKIESDPAYVSSMAMSAVKAGKITLPEAISGTAALYQEAMAVKNDSGGLQVMGLPRQTKYMASVPEFNRQVSSSWSMSPTGVSLATALGLPISPQAAGVATARKYYNTPINWADETEVTSFYTFSLSQKIADQITTSLRNGK